MDLEVFRSLFDGDAIRMVPEALSFLGTLAIGVEVLGVKRRRDIEKQIEAESKERAKSHAWRHWLEAFHPPRGDKSRTFQQKMHILNVAALSYVFTIILVNAWRDNLVFGAWLAGLSTLPPWLAAATVVVGTAPVVFWWAFAMNRPSRPENPGLERFIAGVSIVTMFAYYPALFGYSLAVLLFGTIMGLAKTGVNRLLLFSFSLKKQHKLPSALAVSGLILITLGFLLDVFTSAS